MRNFYNRSFRPGYGYEDRRDYRLNAPSFYDYMAQFQGMLTEFEEYLNTHGQSVKKEVTAILEALQKEYEEKHATLQKASQDKIDHLTKMEEQFNEDVKAAAESKESAGRFMQAAQSARDGAELAYNNTKVAITQQNEKIKALNSIMDIIYPQKDTYIGNPPRDGSNLHQGTNGRLNYVNLKSDTHAGVGITYARVTDLRGVLYEYISPYIQYASLALPTLHEDIASFEFENIGFSNNLINQLRTYNRVYTGVVLADGNSASAHIKIIGNRLYVGLRNFQGLDPTKPYYGDVADTSFTDWVVKTEGVGEDKSAPLTVLPPEVQPGSSSGDGVLVNGGPSRA